MAAIIALIAGVAFLSIAILTTIKQKRKDIEEKEEIIERLKQEVNVTNIKYIQAEERFLAQKNILEQERKNNAQMIEEIKSQNNLALENIKNQLTQISEKNLKQRSEELKSSNIEQLSHILSPMQEQMKMDAARMNGKGKTVYAFEQGAKGGSSQVSEIEALYNEMTGNG